MDHPHLPASQTHDVILRIVCVALGPVCPTAQTSTHSFTLTPAPETSSNGCFTSLSVIGRTVNGVSMYNWADGMSYLSQGVWKNLAAEFEYYDVDPCLGHAAFGDYHHHFYSPCLAEVLGDTGTAHSPLYGFASDGYPVYGPWQSSGVLAKSCWKTRDYSASTSTTGCVGGGRTCRMVNEFDYTQGTTTSSVSSGPSFSASLQTLSGNTITARNGIYYEDYFYNSSCYAQGGEYLNGYNGHSHDNYGFHYHFTVDSTMTATFPYAIGPKFYGCVSSGCYQKACVSSCSTGTSVCGTTTGVAVNAGSCLTTTTMNSTYSPSSKPTASSITSQPTAISSFNPTCNPSSRTTSLPSRNPSAVPSKAVKTPLTESPSTFPTFVPSVLSTESPTSLYIAAASVSISTVLSTSVPAATFKNDERSMQGFVDTIVAILPLNATVTITNVSDIITGSRRLSDAGLTAASKVSEKLDDPTLSHKNRDNLFQSEDMRRLAGTSLNIQYKVTFYIYDQTTVSIIASQALVNISSTISKSVESGELLTLLKSSSDLLVNVSSISVASITNNELVIVSTPNPSQIPTVAPTAIPTNEDVNVDVPTSSNSPGNSGGGFSLTYIIIIAAGSVFLILSAVSAWIIYINKCRSKQYHSVLAVSNPTPSAPLYNEDNTGQVVI